MITWTNSYYGIEHALGLPTSPRIHQITMTKIGDAYQADLFALTSLRPFTPVASITGTRAECVAQAEAWHLSFSASQRKSS